MATLHDPALSELAADRLPLDLSGIEHTAKMALARSSAEDRPVTLDDLSRAARANSIEGLSRLATVVTPRATWSDLVLPNDVTEQLHAVVARVQDRVEILDGWGFSQRRVQVGVSALFAGASGVGKSMAAEVIAGDLGLPLWRVDLARVVSKYIGETEKNLDEVFAAAERSAAMLLFDEADALFGKRSEVQDAHDRYANLEISYLLQRMESYAGIVALSTNMLRHLDDAFARRLTFTIHFPFPDASLRARLWRASWPPEARVARDVDYLHLSRHVLSGANIGNAVVAAAHLAEREGGDVTQFHLERAVEDELSKLGWVPEPEEAA
jgi:SpoVK/Ycf46/Vps4 family AAA+-type ATPase